MCLPKASPDAKIGIILCRDLKIPIFYNGSKIDRSFSYSKIDKALNGNNQAEYQRQYVPHHMQINHFDNKKSELINGSLGLLDFISSPDADSQEEANFRRLIRQKPKKKKTRGFKL